MTPHSPSMEELLERRAFECRLTPDRALQSLDEAEEFLLDRGLLTRTTDCALPGLFEACHEEPYAPESPGFGQWPRTKFPWFGELGARGYPVVAVHRGKNLLVTPEVVRLLDPICRAEIARMEQEDPEWARLLRHLASAGPSELEDLRLELDLKPNELKRLRAPLERCGAIVSRSIVYEDPHRHTSELCRWDQLVPEEVKRPHRRSRHGLSRSASQATAKRPNRQSRHGLSRSASQATALRGDLAELVVTAVRAAVVAPAREVARWFSWTWYWDDAILDDNRLGHVNGYVTVTD
jgi:hypothetical protein